MESCAVGPDGKIVVNTLYYDNLAALPSSARPGRGDGVIDL